MLTVNENNAEFSYPSTPTTPEGFHLQNSANSGVRELDTVRVPQRPSDHCVTLIQQILLTR